MNGKLDELPPHDFDPYTYFCRDCGVPMYAVIDGIVIPGCGMRAATDCTGYDHAETD